MPSDPPYEIILIDDSTDDEVPASLPAPAASTPGPPTASRMSAPSAKEESVDAPPGVGPSKPKSARPYECSICVPPFNIPSLAKLEEHQSANVHSVTSEAQPASSTGLVCPQCDHNESFSSSSTLQTHWNTYHAQYAIIELPNGQTCYIPREKSSFPCPFDCGEHFNNAARLTATHLKSGPCNLAERWPFEIPSNWRTDKPEGMLVLPKRPRGRPPKSLSSTEQPNKPLGRPRKSLPNLDVPKRPVGRPRKSLPATLEVGPPPSTNVASDSSTDKPVAGPSSKVGTSSRPTSTEPKKPVGRPRKSLLLTVEAGPSSTANVASASSSGSSSQPPAPKQAVNGGSGLVFTLGRDTLDIPPVRARAFPSPGFGMAGSWARPANIWNSVGKAQSDLSQSLPTSSTVDSTNDPRRATNESALAEARKHRRSPVGSSEDGPALKKMKTTSSDAANQFWPPKSIKESVPIPSINRARASPFPLSKDSLSPESDEGPSRTGMSALSGRSVNDERTVAERALCKTLSLTPLRYAAIKTKLLDEYKSTGVKPQRGTASKLCETDLNKTGKLLEFLTGIGWFGSERQDRVLSKVKTNPTPMSLLASFEGSRKPLSVSDRTTFRLNMTHRMQRLERMFDRQEAVQKVVKQPRKGADVVVGRGNAGNGSTAPVKLPKKGAGVQVDVD